MITLPNGKICMNEQEAIQWLLDNYPIPFQCSANYAAGTEIGLGTIVNPTPAKVKVGSIIFFADSKVSTVVGLTANGFICSDQYNDLVDDIVYVSNVQLNASGHLIVTLSNGTDIDAGLIKQVSSFSINGSQHLIVSYNDGTSTDLGAIFSGNITISGNLTVTGSITGNSISGSAVTGDSIIENMTGYSFDKQTNSSFTMDYVYAGIVKNGNKLTLALAIDMTRIDSVGGSVFIGEFLIPLSVANKLFPTSIGGVNMLKMGSVTITKDGITTKQVSYQIKKSVGNSITIFLTGSGNIETQFTLNEKYYLRIESTFLLSNNLAA